MSGMLVRFRLRLSLLATLLFIGGTAGAQTAAEQSAALAAPYALEARHQPLSDVLSRFATDHGLTFRLGASAKSSWPSSPLDGWLRAPSGRAFLEQLAQAHHFSWFIAERTLHVSTTRDFAVERIELSGMGAHSARSALEAVGIYDARFGWGELTGQDAVLVGGPRAYRALVHRYLGSRSKPPDAQSDFEPMVFPLRFAQAADAPPSDTHVRERPGLATLMRQLLMRESAAARPILALPAQSDVPPLPSAQPSLGQWIGFSGLPAAPPRVASSARATTAGAFDPSTVNVVADERTNAIIVWADRRWRSGLQQLIDALDQPSSLVSMEVLVVETDATTVAALQAASDGIRHLANTLPPSFDERVAQAIAEHRLRLLNRQTLVGRFNTHTTLAIGGEALHTPAVPNEGLGEARNGRSGNWSNRGDRLDLAARLVPSDGTAVPSIAVDVDLLMAQPTGLPGQIWANTSSVKLDAAVTLRSGGPPRLIASYPVATARAEQRAIFISAKAL